jgi:hypothetical protein
MLRFLFRALALLTFAAGFAAVIVDGTRSIAGNELNLTPLGVFLQGRIPALENIIGRNIHPFLWDPVTVNLLKMPIWAFLALLGMVFLWLASRGRPGVVGRTSRA